MVFLLTQDRAKMFYHNSNHVIHVQKLEAPFAFCCFRCVFYRLALLHVQKLEALFIFCCVWSFGACIVQRPDMEDRTRFDVFLKRIVSLGSVDGDRIPSSQLPVKSLYEYLFDVKDNCWKSWKSFVTVRIFTASRTVAKAVCTCTASWQVRWHDAKLTLQGS